MMTRRCNICKSPRPSGDDRWSKYRFWFYCCDNCILLEAKKINLRNSKKPKPVTLNAWQETDPAIRNEVYDLYYKFYMLAESEKLKTALAVSRCLLMEAAKE